VGALSLAALACGKTGKGESVATGADSAIGGGGSTGEPPVGGTGLDPEAPLAGAGGALASLGGACPEQGSGELAIEITGLPEEIEADVLIAGPEQLEVTVGSTLTGVTAGGYSVTAARVYDADAIVRTVFDATVTMHEFCLLAGGSQTITVAYAAIPTSNKLWTGTDSTLSAFPGDAISETGSRAAAVEIRGSGRSVTFDRDGGVWTRGASPSDPHIVHFPAASADISSRVELSISGAMSNVGCEPAVWDLAFDAEGNLWLTDPCGDVVTRIAAGELGTSRTKEPDATFTGVSQPTTLAFDHQGNLWVSSTTLRRLFRIDAARLGGGFDADPADLELSVMTARTVSSVLSPSGFAFDAAGNLWGLSYMESALFRLTPADQAGTGARTVEAAVAYVVPVAVLTTVPAFDDAGGLWVGMSRASSDGLVGRFSPAQLAMGSGGPFEPEVLITAPALAWGGRASLAFFPAPAGLPLFHSLP